MKFRYQCLFVAFVLVFFGACSDDSVSSGRSNSGDVSGGADSGGPDADKTGDARDPRDGQGDDSQETGDDATGDADADRPDADDQDARAPRCGDGVISSGEVCDDGNTEPGDGCDENCRIETGWTCPDAGQACVAAYCGDGIIAGDEECDDKNRRNGDGCDENCRVEPGYTCGDGGERCQALTCGDGIVAGTERCDDGNRVSGDGCSGTCQIEVGYECPTPGAACEFAVVCGDGEVGGMELCDDGNTRSGDGCDATCQTEPGWRCHIPGEACEPARCGDGLVVGDEQCDDGNATPGDGCNELCKLEPGFTCPTPGQPCVATVCGDGIREGSEACDDGNNDLGDGCTPFCTLEPTCPAGGGACGSTCGDSIRLAGSSKECEDGNTYANDGCSPTCTIEPGWICEDVTHEVDELHLPLVLRDFSTVGADKHPDFETFSGSGATTGMVKDRLGADGKPAFKAKQGMLTSEQSFNQWYRDVPGVNYTFVQTLLLTKRPDETFDFNSSAFFPLDGLGYGDQGLDGGHNYGFTSEVRYWFVYRPGQILQFTGDDDLWVFINKRLALDLGGLHPPVSGEVNLDDEKAALGLQDGELYEIVVFHAERHSTGSNYHLTLGNFINVTTECRSVCGDGIKTADEACDDGVNDGGYGGCNADCTRGPYCGDGDLEPEMEECDNGVNQDLYGVDGCTPRCRKPAYCGDYRVDSLFGEECDDGRNDGSYGTCNADCTLAAHCGDGILQPDFEECDDGNLINGDGCSIDCKLEG